MMVRGSRFSIVLGGLILGLLIFGSAEVFGTVYYVDDVNGLDTNSGTTTGQPWKTIQKAATTMAAGDTAYIRGGTYNIISTITPTNSGSAGNYITFSAYEGENVVVDGGGGTFEGLVLDSSHSYFRFVRLTMQNFGTPSNRWGSMRFENTTGTQPHHIEVLNCTFRNCTRSCIKAFGAHDIIFGGNYFEDSKEGIELAVLNRGNDYNIKIIDCEIARMTQDCVVAKGQRDGSYNPVYWCEDVYITGCEVYNCPDDGFDLWGRYFTVEHCIVRNVDSSAEPPGSWPYDEDGHGFKVYAMDVPVAAGRYSADFNRCLVYNNNREGFKLTSLYMYDSDDYVAKYRMTNCTSANNDYGLLVVTHPDNPVEAEIKNCLVSSKNLDPNDPWNGDDLSRALHIEDTPVIWAVPPDFNDYFTADFDYNLWFTRDWDNTILEPIDFLNELFTGSDVNDGSFYAETGLGEHSISYAPGFVDEDSNNFQLTASSPAVDAGIDIGLPYIGTAPDLGCYEFGTIDVNSPAGYLTTGENWISVPIAAENDGPYSVFVLGKWPNTVYHNLRRYDSNSAGLVEYPTYQSDAVEFGKIIPGGAYKLTLDANQPSIYVSGIEIRSKQMLAVEGSGTRTFYFGNPFKKLTHADHCKIDNGSLVKSLADANTVGWIGTLEHFNPVSKSWETASNDLEPWHAYRFEAYTAGELTLIINPAIAGDVDLEDLRIFCEDWLETDCGSPANLDDIDCIINFEDFAIFGQYWDGGS